MVYGRLKTELQIGYVTLKNRYELQGRKISDGSVKDP